jgi:hypothetical protein
MSDNPGTDAGAKVIASSLRSKVADADPHMAVVLTAAARHLERLLGEVAQLRKDRVRYTATINDLLKHAPPLTLEELERFLYDETAVATTMSATPEGETTND